MILLDPIADNPNWIKQDKGAWDPTILDIIPARPGHMMTWWSHTRPRAPHNFLLPVLPQQSFPPPTMTFYEQTNNTEWGKVILVRLIFAPFMNSSMVIITADDGRPQPSDPASSKHVFGGEWPLSPHSFRIETKKWNGERKPAKEGGTLGGVQTVWAFLMISVSPSSNKSNTNVVCRSPQVIILHFCRRQTKEAISYIYLDVQMWKMAWEQMSFSRNPDFRCPVFSWLMM